MPTSISIELAGRRRLQHNCRFPDGPRRTLLQRGDKVDHVRGVFEIERVETPAHHARQINSAFIRIVRITNVISRTQIQANEPIVRPYIRRTPVLEVDGADFGFDSITIVFKLELFQHSGSFKARGAFMNLLTREVPDVGVVAASGGNHGAAVAFAAMKLGRHATILCRQWLRPRSWIEFAVMALNW